MADFCFRPENFLVVLGAPGIGKTYMCAAIYDYFAGRLDQMYYSEKDLLSSLRSKIGDEQVDYMQHIKTMMQTPLVMIDDLGSTGSPTEWRTEVIFSMLDERYKSGYPTIITSNLTMQEIREKYGLRVESRLLDRKNRIVTAFKSPDLRIYPIQGAKNEHN